MSNTLHLPNKPQRQQQPAQVSHQPASPKPKHPFALLIGRRVTIRLKTGITLSGDIDSLTANVLRLSGEPRILERDGTSWLVPQSRVIYTDLVNVAFLLEGVQHDC
jgi:hypothetical protein